LCKYPGDDTIQKEDKIQVERRVLMQIATLGIIIQDGKILLGEINL